jgi:biopolymer transport protein ExbD/biopolymer transport protein TolR
MIDVLLVLLIIFMMIQPQAPSGLRSQIPQPPQSDAPAPPAAIVVEVTPGADEKPVYRINQTPVPQSQLASQLRAIFAARLDRTMFVKGDAALDFQDVAQVVDLGHAAGVVTIGLITPGSHGGD